MKTPKFEMWPIDAIKPYELNSKIHDEKQIAAIATSIERFGFDQPIVVDSAGVIIKGHGRRMACLQLGLKHVPVLIREDLSLEQANAARIADNKVAVGEFDTDLLKAELEALDIEDLRGIFEDKELDFLAVDLTQMDSSLFVSDLEGAVAEQEAETQEKFREAEEKRVSIAKALGFKDIAGADQIFVNRFVANIEASSGLKGADAFVSFIKKTLQTT